MESSQAPAEDALLSEVARLARAYARDALPADAADDLAQDIALAVLERIRAGRPVASGARLRGFIRTMVRRKAIDQMRRGQRRAEREVEYEREHGGARQGWMSPEALLDDAEMSAFHRRTLSGLPESCRRAYLMVREEQATYEHVAEALAVSRNAVCYAVVAAQREFRRALEEMGVYTPRVSRSPRRAA